jgi:hypothetical protein
MTFARDVVFVEATPSTLPVTNNTIIWGLANFWGGSGISPNLYIALKFCVIKGLGKWSRDSVVGIATGYGLDEGGVGVRVPVGSRIFSTSSRPVPGPTQPPIQWVPGALSPGVKRPGREADHSPPTTVEIKKIWIYTSIPPYAFMA